MKVYKTALKIGVVFCIYAFIFLLLIAEKPVLADCSGNAICIPTWTSCSGPSGCGPGDPGCSCQEECPQGPGGSGIVTYNCSGPSCSPVCPSGYANCSAADNCTGTPTGGAEGQEATPNCGNGVCNVGETCSNCPGDCGSCPSGPYCGDGTCNSGESCSNCSTDCGACCSQVSTPSIVAPSDVFEPSSDLFDWTSSTPTGFGLTYDFRINKDPFTTGNSCTNSNGSCTSNSCTKDQDRCQDTISSTSYNYDFIDDTKYTLKVRAKNNCSTSPFSEKTVTACQSFQNDPAISDPTYNQLIEPGSYTVNWNTLSIANKYVVAVNDVTTAVNNGTTPISLDCKSDGSGAQYANDQCLVVNTGGDGTPSEKSVSGFVHNHYYNLKVQAFRNCGRESNKSSVVRVRACNAVAQPSPPTVSRCSNSITWNQIANADGYYVSLNDTTFSSNPVQCDFSKPNGAVGQNDACFKIVGRTNTSASYAFKDSHAYTVKVWAYNECREGLKAQTNLAAGVCCSPGQICNIECSAIGSTNIKYQWESAGGPYWLQADTASPSANTKADGSYIKADTYNSGDVTSTSVVIGEDTSGKQLIPGTTYYGHVRQNTPGKTWSQSVGCPLPTPTLYPTIGIHGDLRSFKKSGRTCQNITPSGLSLSVQAQGGNPPGLESKCSNSGPNYSCSVKLDNQNYSSTPPSQTLILNVTSTDGYAPGYWVDGATNACKEQGPNSNRLDIDFSTGPYDFDKDILFTTTGWIKLKNASFVGKEGASWIIGNIIPATVDRFNSSDTSDPYFIVNQEGSGIADNAYGGESYPWSQTNWHHIGVTNPNKLLNPKTYYEYLKARRSFKKTTIDALSDGEINVIEGSVTLDETSKTNVTKLDKPTVIVITGGNLTLSLGQFNQTKNNSLAFVVDGDINFKDNNPAGSTQEINGIFIGRSINFDDSERDIQITGNIVATSGFNFQRERDEIKKPSLFMIHEPSYFIDLLPLLSIQTYDWRQLQ